MDKKGSNIKNNCFTLRGKRFSRTETRVRFVLYLLHNKILKLDIKNQHVQSLSWLKQTYNVHHLYQMKETTK